MDSRMTENGIFYRWSVVKIPFSCDDECGTKKFPPKCVSDRMCVKYVCGFLIHDRHKNNNL